MLKMICDKCGDDCGRNAFDIRVNLLENPTPIYITDIGDPKISSTNLHYRVLLCQHCYRKMGFPNIFQVVEDKEFVWRDEEGANETD